MAESGSPAQVSPEAPAGDDGAAEETRRIGRDEVVDAHWVDNGPGWVGVLLRDAETVLGLATKLTCDPQHRGLYRHAAMAPTLASAPATGLRPHSAIAVTALRG